MRVLDRALVFGMELDTDKKRMRRKFDRLDPSQLFAFGIRPMIDSGHLHARRLEIGNIIVVELVTMAMPFGNILLAIDLVEQAVLFQGARVSAQTHRPAHVLDVLLLVHDMDHRILGLGIHLGGIGCFPAQNIAGELDYAHLHPQADT